MNEEKLKNFMARCSMIEIMKHFKTKDNLSLANLWEIQEKVFKKIETDLKRFTKRGGQK